MAKGFLLKDPSQPQDIARLVRHFLCHLNSRSPLRSIIPVHPSDLNILLGSKLSWQPSEITSGLFWVVVYWFLAIFLKNVFFVTGTINDIRSLTWKA